MADVFTPKKRSWVMSRIRSKNTKIDLKMKRILSDTNYKFEMYPKMFGSPDFVLERKRIAIFCDGDFWHGFGYGLVDPFAEPEKITRTLSARYYKDGAEILIKQKRNKNPRRLTPRECARLMGFPDRFNIVVSDTQAYRQFGNALVVPLVTEIAKEVVKCLKENKKRITILDYA